LFQLYLLHLLVFSSSHNFLTDSSVLSQREMGALLEDEDTSVDEPQHEKGRSSVRLVYLLPECICINYSPLLQKTAPVLLCANIVILNTRHPL
jgi:hypothetical protein